MQRACPVRVCWRCGRREALALSRWPEEPAGGRRQEENKGSPLFRPTHLLPGLREQLRGVCACAWRGCVCATHTYVEMLGGCVRPGGIRTLGYTANPCSDSKSEVSLAAPVCAGCSRVLCRRRRALVQGEQGQRAQPKWGFASYLRISLLRCRSQASQGAQSHPACQPPRTLQDSSLSSLPFPRRHSLCSVSSPSEGNTPPPWPRYVYPK